MSLERKALSTLICGLNASSLDLDIHNMLQIAIKAGSVSDAEMIAYTAYKSKKICNDDYNALMFIFEKCEDELICK